MSPDTPVLTSVPTSATFFSQRPSDVVYTKPQRKKRAKSRLQMQKESRKINRKTR